MRRVLPLIFCLSAQAATNWVSLTGDNGNDGSSGSPWRNIYYGLTNISAGDTLMIKDGVYTGDERLQRCTVAGASGNWITVQAENAHMVTNNSYNLQNDYYIFRGLCFDTNSQTPFGAAEGMINGSGNADYIYVDNCWFYSMAASGGAWSGQSSIFCIKNNYAAAWAGAEHGWVITNCLIQNCHYIDFRLYGYDHIIVSNRIIDQTGWDLFWPQGSNIWIIGNYTSNHMAGPGHPDIYQANAAENGETSVDVVVEGNRHYDMFQMSSLEQDQDSESNYATNYRRWTFKNNLFVRCAEAFNVTMPDFKIYNNVWVDCTTNTSNPITLNFGVKGWASNTVLFGNAFIRCGGPPSNAGFGWYDTEQPESNSLIIADYNFVTGLNWAAKTTGSDARFNWSAWDWENNGINGGNPSMVWIPEYADPRSGPRGPENYRLHLGSILLDAGTNTDIGYDLDKTTRPINGVYDIGAYEGVATISNDLVAWWNFDQPDLTTNAPDASGNQEIGWKMSTTNWIVGTNVSGHDCAYFNVVTNGEWEPNQGNGTYIAVTNLNQLKNLTNGSLCLWVYYYTNDIQAARQDCALLDGGYGNESSGKTNTYVLRRRWSDNQSDYVTTFHRFDATSNPYRLVEFPDPIGSNQGDSGGWNHIAVTWSGTNGAEGTVTGYYDGTNYWSTNMVNDYFTVTNNYNWLAIGAWGHDGTPQMEDDAYPNNGWFEGVLDDIRIYNRELSAAEVSQIFLGTEGGGGAAGGEASSPIATITPNFQRTGNAGGRSRGR